MQQIYHYKVKTKVQNQLGALARITILLRKFNIDIQSMDAEPLDSEKRFYRIDFLLNSVKNKDSMKIVMEKLQRLIPVIEVEWGLM